MTVIKPTMADEQSCGLSQMDILYWKELFQMRLISSVNPYPADD